MPKPNRSSKPRSRKQLPWQTVSVSNVHLAVGVLLIALVGCAIQIRVFASTRPVGKLAPSTGVLFGAYTYINKDDSLAGREKDVAARESIIGRRYDIDKSFFSITDPFPNKVMQWDASTGHTPMVAWEFDGLTVPQINSGSGDAYFAKTAEAVKAFGKDMFISPLSEMNGDWFEWNASKYNNDPSQYISAWRHIHDIFVAHGATNVAWVWSPNYTDEPTASWNHWTNYYPGDAYVDWVGIDGYNWGTSGSTDWEEFAAIMKPVYKDYASRKPIMIGEMGCAEQGGSKATWIASQHAALKSTFQSIAAVVWFDTLKERDWQIDSSATALAAYKAMVNDPILKPGKIITTPSRTGTLTPPATPTPTQRASIKPS